MAQSAQVIAETARAAGYPPSVLERMVRDLRDAALAPMGQLGGSRKHGQFEASHLANLPLAFAGPQPADAAEAVKLLRPLIYLAVDNQPPYAGPGNLGEVLERLIDGVAQGRISSGGLGPSMFEALNLPFITLSCNPLEAKLIWLSSDGHERTDTYGPDARIPFDVNTLSRLRRGGAVSKATNIYPALIQTMGFLWLDALKQQKPDLFTASAENETAAPPARDATALRTTQDHHSTVPTAHTPEPRLARENAQALSSDGPGPSCKRHRRDHEPSHSPTARGG